ncbi:response regulator transcription factor [Paraburkholderia acidicola]|uniref:Response regulator transcription factor n=1 Tax=Paraburkholderia acidicola TaxID=1912599 RepID=A0ABV1LZ55_9BURK
MSELSLSKSLQIRVIVADDHPVVVMGIRKLIENEPDIALVATAGTLDQLHSALANQECDVLVCDYAFDGDGALDGLQLIARVRRRYPDVRILTLTANTDPMLMRRVMAMGVGGFLTKASPAQATIALAIRALHRRQVFIDPYFSPLSVNQNQGKTSRRGDTEDAALSNREFEVVRLLARGMTVGEIAEQTNRSVKTVSTQKIRAMKKLEARNDLELASRFREISTTRQE